MDAAGPIECGLRVAEGDSDLYRDYRPTSASLIYPPTAAVLMLPYGLASRAWGPAVATGLLDVTGRLCILATIVLSAGLLPMVRARWTRWLAAILVLAAFYPLRWTLICVQVQSLITMLMAGAILAYSRDRGISAGVLTGLAACLKPNFGLVVLFALARRQWRFAASACATGAILIAVSLATVGIAPWKDYVFRVVPAHSAGFGYYPNQTVNGLVHRWQGHSLDLVPAPDTRAARLATTLSIAVLIVLAVWPRGGNRNTPRGSLEEVKETQGACGPAAGEARTGRVLDLGIAALAATMASPSAWEHHYAWTVVLFCGCAAAWEQQRLPTAYLVILAAGYLLAGTFFEPFRAFSSGPASLVNSTGLFGAILLLGAAWCALRTTARTA